jgi:hypothetical protein
MISGDKLRVSVTISAMSMHYSVPLIGSRIDRKKSVTKFRSRGVASLLVDHFSTLSSVQHTSSPTRLCVYYKLL